jgi:hypothetical protein
MSYKYTINREKKKKKAITKRNQREKLTRRLETRNKR